MRLSIKADFSDVQRQLDAMKKDLADKVLARTLNRVADKARTQAVRQISARYALKQTKVRERLVVRKAFAQGRLAVELVVTGNRRAINLIAFATPGSFKQIGKRKPVKVKVVRTGPVKAMQGQVFIGNKGRTLFRRTGASRLPIEPVRTIDVPQMFNARRINEQLMAMIRAELPREFAAQANYALGGPRMSSKAGGRLG